jgi:hypothetical protein
MTWKEVQERNSTIRRRRRKNTKTLKTLKNLRHIYVFMIICFDFSTVT